LVNNESQPTISSNVENHQHCASNKFTALDITQLGHSVRYFCKFNANLINSIIILIKSQLFSTDSLVYKNQ